MTLFFIYLVIALIMFATGIYLLGRNHKKIRDDADLFGLGFVIFGISITWPIMLAGAIVLGPFYFLYKAGEKYAKLDEEKRDMWNTLKD